MLHLYIGNAIVITRYEFANHLKALDEVLQKIVEAVLEVNTEKSFFG